MMSCTLDLDELGQGRPGITEFLGGVLGEAAAVCLEEQEHAPGIEIIIVDSSAILKSCELRWFPVGENVAGAYDPREPTEFGACGIAVLLIERVTDWTVVERSVIGDGFDYWLGSSGDNSLLFQNREGRLEVSGIREGTRRDIERRVKAKIAQVNRGGVGTDLPAYVIVVEFSEPESHVRRC